MALTIEELEKNPGLPKLSRQEYIDNLASHGIACDKNGDLYMFDIETLSFHQLCGLSNCITLMTTKGEQFVSYEVG